ncbi:putative reverse transcriptase domain-containing protein [Tanacetum coccineum]
MIHPETTTVTNSNPSRGRMSPKSTTWGLAKGSLLGDLCTNPSSAIFTTIGTAHPAVATSVNNMALSLAIMQDYYGNTMLLILRRGNGEDPREMVFVFVCGASGHFKRDCPKLKNKDGGNGNTEGWVYAVRNAERRGNAPGNPDANVVMGMFLLNNHYASILFDTCCDISFISTDWFLINIAPTLLENCYDVELADGKLVKIDTIIRGCTLNFLGHPFNIDLMPVELGSFDVIIGMDWLRRCHAVILCDEKLVQIPYGNETLTFGGNESNNGRESRLTVISCSKAQEYMAKGCQVFLAHISAKKEEDKSKGKQVKDVPIV